MTRQVEITADVDVDLGAVLSATEIGFSAYGADENVVITIKDENDAIVTSFAGGESKGVVVLASSLTATVSGFVGPDFLLKWDYIKNWPRI